MFCLNEYKKSEIFKNFQLFHHISHVEACICVILNYNENKYWDFLQVRNSGFLYVFAAIRGPSDLLIFFFVFASSQAHQSHHHISYWKRCLKRGFKLACSVDSSERFYKHAGILIPSWRSDMFHFQIVWDWTQQNTRFLDSFFHKFNQCLFTWVKSYSVYRGDNFMHSFISQVHVSIFQESSWRFLDQVLWDANDCTPL